MQASAVRVMEDPEEDPEARVRVGNAVKGRAGLVEGQDLMKAEARVKIAFGSRGCGTCVSGLEMEKAVGKKDVLFQGGWARRFV